MADLTGKVAIVVGASSGMGEATAKTYVEAGAKVVLAARSGDKLEALAEELGENALACATDARDKAAAAALVQRAVAAYGRVDILAYVTGTNIPDRALKVLTEETWEMMLGTNLTGAFHCTQAALPVMREQGQRIDYLRVERLCAAAGCLWGLLSGEQARDGRIGPRHFPGGEGERRPHLRDLSGADRHTAGAQAAGAHPTGGDGRGVDAAGCGRCLPLCRGAAGAGLCARVGAIASGAFLTVKWRIDDGRYL